MSNETAAVPGTEPQTPKIDDGGPAFPVPKVTSAKWQQSGDTATQVQTVESEPGMTLRDYFAAKVMQGEIAGQSETDGYYEFKHFPGLAVRAYKMADAMLAARKAGSRT